MNGEINPSSESGIGGFACLFFNHQHGSRYEESIRQTDCEDEEGDVIGAGQ